MPKFHKAFGECTGPFGFPMREDAARELDEFLDKNSEDEVGYFRKSYPGHEYFVEKEHADVSIITDTSVDKDKEAVDIESLDFSEFQKNPQVAYSHTHTIPPVGRCLWTKVIKNEQIRAKTAYHERPENYPKDIQWFPDYVYGLIKSNQLPGKSIGGVAKKRAPTEEDLIKRPFWKEASTIRYNGRVYEYSVVGIPCNNNAEVEFVAKSLLKLEDDIISKAFPELSEVVFDLRKGKSDFEPDKPLVKDFLTVSEFKDDVTTRLELELGDIQNRIPEIVETVLKRLLGKVA